MKKNDVIKLLEYGMEYPDGVTKSEMLDKLDVEENKIEELWREVRDKRHDPSKHNNNKISDLFYIIHKEDIDEPNDPLFFEKAKITINIDGLFKILQYQEINDARKSARRPHWTAIIAIIISMAFGIIQIILK